MFYFFTRIIFHLIRLPLLITYEVEGQENLPKSGSYMIVINHLSLLDTPLIFMCVPSSSWLVLIGKSYENVPVLGWFLRTGGAVYIDRQNFDRKAIQATLKALKERPNTTFGIAPEGTRSKSGKLIPAKNGPAYLALKADLTLVPMVMLNTDEWYGNWRRFRPTHLRTKIGKPFRLENSTGRVKSDQLNDATELIMAQIAQYLPPERWGAYADSPILAQLLGNEAVTTG